MSEAIRPIPFPSPCDRRYCHQMERLAELEAKSSYEQSRLDRIEKKLDRILFWVIGTLLSVGGWALATLAAQVLRNLKP